MASKRILTYALLLGFMLMTTAAHATTPFTMLFTPPLFPDEDSQIDCYLVNVSDQTRDATISVLNRDGQVLKFVPVTLESGTEEVASVPASDQPRYCKFVVEGARHHYRASVLVRVPGLGSISALPAE